MTDTDTTIHQAHLVEQHALKQLAMLRRSATIRLRGLLDENDRMPEHALLPLLESAPWLLAPERTQLGMNDLASLRERFEEWHLKNIGQRLNAFPLNVTRGGLWTVVAKKPRAGLSDDDLDQGLATQESLTRFLSENADLDAQFPDRPLVLIADHIDELNSPSRRLLEIHPSIHHFTWSALLDHTDHTHDTFLAQVEEQHP